MWPQTRYSVVLVGFLIQLTFAYSKFSTSDDVVAFPQFEVRVSASHISEHDANVIRLGPQHSSLYRDKNPGLDSNSQPSQGYDSDVPKDTNSEDKDAERVVDETHLTMALSTGTKYICTVPIINSPVSPNHTISEVAKSDEARELIRITAAGWQLIRNLEDHCLYFIQGWWSYQFCFGIDVVQFHASQISPKDNIPIRDPGTLEYVLGRDGEMTARADVDTASGALQRKLDGLRHSNEMGHQGDTHRDQETNTHNAVWVPRNVELAVKDNQKYLIQRLDQGTICDLTGRPRSIEIQYHCSSSTPVVRIGWIKEVTTCMYQMGIYSPQLCSEAAFFPPKPTKAHPVLCHQILDPGRVDSVENDDNLALRKSSILISHPMADLQGHSQQALKVGNIVLGGRKIIRAGDSDGHGVKLPLPRGFQRSKKHERDAFLLSKAQAPRHQEPVQPEKQGKAEDKQSEGEVLQELRDYVLQYNAEGDAHVKLVQNDDGTSFLIVVNEDEHVPETGSKNDERLAGNGNRDRKPSATESTPSEKQSDKTPKKKNDPPNAAGNKNSDNYKGSEEEFFVNNN